MASSKSAARPKPGRSLSVSSFLSLLKFDSDPSSDADKRAVSRSSAKKDPERSFTLPINKDDAVLSRVVEADHPAAGDQASSEPALMPPTKTRSTTKRNRLSMFFPSLITSPVEPEHGENVHRKPIPPDSPLKKTNTNPSSTVRERPATSGHMKDWYSSEKTDFRTSETTLNDGHSDHQTVSLGSGDSTTPGKTKLQKADNPVPLRPEQPPPPPPGRVDSPVQSTEMKTSTKLTKRSPSGQRSRRNSMQDDAHKRSSSSQAGANLMPRQQSPGPDSRGRRSVSAQPPDRRSTLGGTAPSVTTPTLASRPGSSHGSQSPQRDADKRGRLRKSWLPGGRSRSNSVDLRNAKGASAWILGQTNTEYNTAILTNGEKVPELWNEAGTVLVCLHTKSSGIGPSFKVPSFVIDHSLVFQDILSGDLDLEGPISPTGGNRSFLGRDSLSVADAARNNSVQSPPPEEDDAGDVRLYVPNVTLPGQEQNTSQQDVDRLVAIRNMFAFLTGQPLVCTKAQPTLFAVLLRISSLLSEFEFCNEDGSTFGASVEMAFGFFMEQMALADVRHSREKTLEALVLGERMRSWDLFSEAFAHAVGKYSALRDLRSPLWEQVSAPTRQRLERAHLDLVSRQASVNNRLESFEFPSLFSGTANSTSMSEYRNVKYGVWRKSFGRMRQFVLSFYKTNFGSWPPKARSKKNPFSESGLNRLVLKILYSDLCALYDLIVDRESVTPRVIDQTVDDVESDLTRPEMSALRKILTEYETSSPPVLPPIPYDIPRVPDMRSIKENFHDLPQKEQAKLERNLQSYEFLLILNKSYDFETSALKIPFIKEFMEWEQKEAKGKSVPEMADQRIGYWLFLYVVIQSLPMLVVDAPGLHFTEGVEYFLCQPPKGHPPWMGDAQEVRKRWYEVAGGAGYVELSADAVEFSVEGIYHRSHCWLAAKQWETNAAALPPPPEDGLSPLQAPQSVFEDLDPPIRATCQVAATGRPGYRSSVALGLEPVPMPASGHSSDHRTSRIFSAGDSPAGGRPVSMMMLNRSRSSGNLNGMAGSPTLASPDRQNSQSGSTFDDILKDMDNKPKKKKTFFG
ncbi:hypothetical protein PG994_011266 [Apiospora phragmitis]|uniref:DUF8004 domain-containing protein n=1 Tax=Apiospora phragmitis TaxID=2905665 RepID=A0ABR1TUJ8_9PEZI